MRYISRFKNSIRASSVYSLAFMLTFALAAGLTTYEEAAAQPSITLTVDTSTDTGTQTSIDESLGVNNGSVTVTVTAQASAGFSDDMRMIELSLSGSATRTDTTVFVTGDDYYISNTDFDTNMQDGKLLLQLDDPSMINGVSVHNSSGTMTLTINLNDDGAFERPETIIVSGALSGSIVRSATIDVIDDDYDITLATSIKLDVEGGFVDVDGQPNPDDPTVDEDVTTPVSVMVMATLSSTRTSPVTISLNYSGTAPSSYYTAAGTPSITIAAGLTTGSTTVTIDPNDNDTRGGNKSIIIGGTSGNLQVKPAIGFDIEDNEEAPSVSLTAAPKSITEDAGATNVRVTAELTGALLESAATVKVDVDANDGHR